MPTPELPTSITFSACSTNRSVASSSTIALGTEGWKSKSKSARLFTKGNPALRMRLSRLFALFAAASAAVISQSAPQKPLSPSATMRM